MAEILSVAFLAGVVVLWVVWSPIERKVLRKFRDWRHLE